MTAEQNNKLRMYTAVETVLDAHPTALDRLQAVCEQVAADVERVAHVNAALAERMAHGAGTAVAAADAVAAAHGSRESPPLLQHTRHWITVGLFAYATFIAGAAIALGWVDDDVTARLARDVSTGASTADDVTVEAKGTISLTTAASASAMGEKSADEGGDTAEEQTGSQTDFAKDRSGSDLAKPEPQTQVAKANNESKSQTTDPGGQGNANATQGTTETAGGVLRIAASIGGSVIVSDVSKADAPQDRLYSEQFACPVDGISLPEIEPRTLGGVNIPSLRAVRRIWRTFSGSVTRRGASAGKSCRVRRFTARSRYGEQAIAASSSAVATWPSSRSRPHRSGSSTKSSVNGSK